LFVLLDRSVATPAQAINALVIPAGHNVDVTTLLVEESDVEFRGIGEVPSPWVILHTHTLTSAERSGGVIYTGVLDTPSTKRYVRVRFPEENPGFAAKHELGELFLSFVRPITENTLDSEWRDSPIPNFEETEMQSGEVFRLSNGPIRRDFEFTFNLLRGADQTLFDDLQSGTNDFVFPFYFIAPEVGELPVFVNVANLTRVQQSDLPRGPAGPAFEISIRMREVLT
jgi:hypothetical protein